MAAVLGRWPLCLVHVLLLLLQPGHLLPADAAPARTRRAQPAAARQSVRSAATDHDAGSAADKQQGSGLPGSSRQAVAREADPAKLAADHTGPAAVWAVSLMQARLSNIAWNATTPEETWAAFEEAMTDSKPTGAPSSKVLVQQLRRLKAAIAALPPRVLCTHDATLPPWPSPDAAPAPGPSPARGPAPNQAPSEAPSPAAGSAAGQQALVAVTAHNSEAVLPHLVAQLLELVARLGREHVFVSVCESGSQDGTGAWLQLLEDLLAHVGVRARFVLGARLSHAADQQAGTAFTADLRNCALEPLWPAPAGAGGDGRQDGSAAPRAGGAVPGSSAGAGGQGSWAFGTNSRVVFISADVVFCADQVVRLLLQEGDMVCGMDFAARPAGVAWPAPSHLVYPFGPHGPTMADASETEYEIVFSDVWVARDINGLPFSNFRPFAPAAYSRGRLQEGLPLPCKCCWNGLAVLAAAPFLAGLRFREPVAGECAASEASLLCHDLQRASPRGARCVVDPGVRVAYDGGVTRHLYGGLLDFMPVTSWRDVAAAPPIDWRYVPRKSQLFCCGRSASGSHVDWQECHAEDIYATNYTRRWQLQQQQQGQASGSSQRP